MDRISWDEYFMSMAFLAAQRSTCLRRMVGAVLVRNKRILATGYNGAPKGFPHCEELGCLREEMKIPSGEREEICRAVHGEMNAIIQAAIHGVSTEGADLYCTTFPCITCLKALTNAGIKRIFYVGEYKNDMLKMFKDYGPELIKMDYTLELIQ